jgi:hypothetical protein
MKSWLTLTFLCISGLLLLGIGGAILWVPQTFHAANGIHLGDDPNLLSEIRAPGGLLTGAAILILLGTFRPGMRSLAVLLTTLTYGTFGLARLLGLVLDGMPSSGLMGATVLELIVAAIGLTILWSRPAPQVAFQEVGTGR